MRGLLCTRKGVLQYRRPHTLQRSACLSASQLALWPASAARSARSTICSSVRTIRRYRHSQRSCCLVLSAAVKRGTASLGPAALSLVVLLTSVNCTVAVTLPQQGIGASVPGGSTASVAERAREARSLTEKAHSAIEEQQFDVALDSYTSLVDKYGDLALASYARIGRALLLYQTGQRQESVLELQGLASSLRGYAEVHAALAAMLYGEKPPAVQRAEVQWEIASEFDTRFADPVWVAREKHWPPAMLQALKHFLNLGQ